MKARRMGLRGLSFLGAVGLAVASGGCATTPSQPTPDANAQPDLLIVATDRYELHVRDGRVYELVPAPAADAPASVRPVEDLGEFRTLYEGGLGHPLPASEADGSVKVNGWSGLTCVRKGHACGAQPDGVPESAVRLRFQF